MPKKKKRAFSFERFDDGGSEVILLVSGPVDAEASAVLGPTCARILESDRQVTLDLSSVNFADGVGLQLLLSLFKVGVRLSNVPSLIAQRIDIVRHPA